MQSISFIKTLCSSYITNFYIATEHFMKIIFIRHGETEWNLAGRIQGQTDTLLAENGKLQLKRTGEKLAEQNLNVDYILSSPMRRALESAQIVAGQLHFPEEQIKTSPLFLERKFGAIEGMTWQEALSHYPENHFPGMESIEELLVRAKKAVEYCIQTYPDKTIIVTTHGAFLKSVIQTLTEGQVDYMNRDIWLDNGSYCIAERNHDHWNLSLYNPKNDYMRQSIP